MIMKRFLSRAPLALVAFSAAAIASAQAATLEGRWANPRHSVIVHVARCGNALCGTVAWANANNRGKGVDLGTRVLTDLRPAGDGVYKGRAYDPKHDMDGSATVRQAGPNVMIVKGCAMWGLVCKEQRWTRVS
jgi:uncharacterized protein (DUF2147 family)